MWKNLRSAAIGVLASSLAIVVVGGATWGCSSGPVQTPSEATGTESSAVILPGRGGTGREARASIAHVAASTPFGDIGGASSVSNGAYHYNVPLVVPKGRAGLQPHLSLAYVSTDTNGPLGAGWSLAGLSVISKCGHNYSRDGFTAGLDFETDYTVGFNQYCLDGQKLIRTSGSTDGLSFITEKRDFSEIKGTANTSNARSPDPESFRVRARDGRILSYGTNSATNNSRVDAGGAHYAYYLSRIEDRYGNAIDFTYASGGTGISRVISNVTYGKRSVRFTWETRTDMVYALIQGTDSTLSKRLKRIDVYSEYAGTATDKLQTSYRLSYDLSQFTRRSQLTSISRCDAGNACLPPTTFQWNAFAAPVDRPPYGDARDFVLTGLDASNETGDALMLADLNGDGRDDILRENVLLGPTSTWTVKVSEADPTQPSGFKGPVTNLPLTQPGSTQGIFLDDSRAADFEGDGKAEVVIRAVHPGMSAPGFKSFKISPTTAGTLVADTARDAIWSQVPQGLGFERDELLRPERGPLTIADFNGDGNPDIFAQKTIATVAGQTDTMQYFLGVRPGAAINTVATPAWALEAGKDLRAIDFNADRRVEHVTNRARTLWADVNGDGIPDLISFEKIGSHAGPMGLGMCSNQIWFGVYLSSAQWRQPSGGVLEPPAGTPFSFTFDQTISGLTNPTGCTPQAQGTPEYYPSSVRVGDFNGDGRRDLVFLDVASTPKVVSGGWTSYLERPPVLLISTGAGFTPIVLPFGGMRARHDGPPGVAWKGRLWAGTAVGDVDGDGLTDIVQLVGHPSAKRAEVIKWVKTPTLTHRYDVIVGVSSGLTSQRADAARWQEKIAYADLPTLAAAGRYTRLTLGMTQCGPTGTVCVTRGPLVVDKHWHDRADATAANATKYDYSAATFDRGGRGFLGFQVVRATDPLHGARTDTIRAIDALSIENATAPIRHYATTTIDDYGGIRTPPVTTGVALTTGLEGSGNVGRLFYDRLVQVQTIMSDCFAGGVTSSPMYAKHVITTNEVVLGSPALEIERGSYRLRTTRVSTQEKEEPSITCAALGSPAAWDVEKVDEWSNFDVFDNAQTVRSYYGDRTLTDITLTRTFSNDTSAWLIGLVTREQDRRKRSLLYDETRATDSTYYPTGRLKDVTVGAGNVDTELKTTFVYNTNGTLASVARRGVDQAISATPQTRTTTITYDADGLYPTDVQSGAADRVTTVYDRTLGQVIAEIDANGVGTDYVYDGFGRQLGTYPDSEQATAFKYEAALSSTANIAYVTRKLVSAGSGATCVAGQILLNGRCFAEQSSEHTDVRGLSVIKQEVTFDGTTFETLFSYDLRRRLTSVSTPHLVGSTGFGVTTYTYDGINRPKRTTHPDATFSELSYPGPFGRRQLRSEVGHIKVEDRGFDIPWQGTIEQLQGPNGEVWIETEPLVDGFGQVRRIMTFGASATATTTFEYDSRGRRTSLTDNVSGTSSTAYNAFGEARQEQNGSGTWRLVHDGYGRMTGRFFGSTKIEEFAWDGTNGLGKVQRAANLADGVTHSLSYNTLGQLEKKTLAVDVRTAAGVSTGSSASYDIAHFYDSEGRRSETRYPKPPTGTQLIVKPQYNVRSQLTKLQTDSGTMLWERVSSTPRLRKEKSGDGAVTTYDWGDGRRLNAITTVNTANQSLQHLLYAYSGDGALQQKQDFATSQTETMQYDSLGRLSRWTNTAGDTGCTRYEYNELGAMTAAKQFSNTNCATATTTETYTPGTGTVPGNNPFTVAGYTYDSTGRMTAKAGEFSYTYNHWNQPATYTLNATGRTERFQYDARGRRIAVVTNADSSTITFDDDFTDQLTPSTGGHRYVHQVRVAGRTVVEAMQSFGSGGTGALEYVYPHQDKLGSVTLRTSSTATPERNVYEAFGKQTRLASMPGLASGLLTEGFTGHDHDVAGSDRINMKGRIFSTKLRRFLTPDPIISRARESQGWNRYAYVGNQPFNFTDPSGFFYSSEPHDRPEEESGDSGEPVYDDDPANPAPDIPPGDPSCSPGSSSCPTCPPGYRDCWVDARGIVYGTDPKTGKSEMTGGIFIDDSQGSSAPAYSGDSTSGGYSSATPTEGKEGGGNSGGSGGAGGAPTPPPAGGGTTNKTEGTPPPPREPPKTTFIDLTKVGLDGSGIILDTVIWINPKAKRAAELADAVGKVGHGVTGADVAGEIATGDSKAATDAWVGAAGDLAIDVGLGAIGGPIGWGVKGAIVVGADFTQNPYTGIRTDGVMGGTGCPPPCL